MTSPSSAQACLAEGREALFRFELRDAEALFRRARSLARRDHEGVLEERAFCLHSGLLIEAGDSDQVASGLRAVLSTSAELRNRYLAGYNLARAFELRREIHKATFYARSAMQWGQLAGVGQELAASYNQLGNLMVARGDLAAAHPEYERAQAMCPEGRPLWRAMIEENLGYVEAALGHLGAGAAMIERSLATLETLGTLELATTARLSLSFARLQAGRGADATHLALESLAAADPHGEQAKTALYLLAEAAKINGHRTEARIWFERLLREFYPQQLHLLELLMILDLRGLVSIKT
ncbi:MAG: hypothetical protein ABI609_06400 [Acidobacteriota bacterium]